MTAEVETQETELELKPYDTPENRKLLLSGGKYVEPKIRLGTFSDEEYEDFINQLVLAHLKEKNGYTKVCHIGGANDKGRDIIGYLANGTQDVFQCKRYNDPLIPTDVYKEIGKTLYYSYLGRIPHINKYFLVATKGIGATLLELLEFPEKLKTRLIDVWEEQCSSKIARNTKINLDGDFLVFFDKFDFSKIDHITPDEQIEMHKHTRYHAVTFGGRLRKRVKPSVPEGIEDRESPYVAQMLEAFSEHEGRILKEPKHLNVNSLSLFNHYRSAFFSADALRVFARDNLPDETDFHEFVEEIGDAITTPFHSTSGTYTKMINCINMSVTVNIQDNPLEFYITVLDKIGACQHLVNNGRFKWKS